MNFKAGDYITFNNEQEWNTVLTGLLELGENVYTGDGKHLRMYLRESDCYFKNSEGSLCRSHRNLFNDINNVTEDFMKLLSSDKSFPSVGVEEWKDGKLQLMEYAHKIDYIGTKRFGRIFGVMYDKGYTK